MQHKLLLYFPRLITSEHNGLAQLCSLNLVWIDTSDASKFMASLDVSAQPKTSYAIILHSPEKHILPRLFWGVCFLFCFPLALTIVFSANAQAALKSIRTVIFFPCFKVKMYEFTELHAS